MNRRAARALRLVLLGEASSTRQVLEGAEVALGTSDTFETTSDVLLYCAVPEDILSARPDHPFSLDCEKFLLNLRSSERGAAAGPSGMSRPFESCSL